MAVQHAQITIGTTAVELTAGDADAIPGQVLLFTAPTGATLYLGGPGVTAANGVPLTAGQVISAEMGAGDRLYAVASASVTLPVLRVGV